MTTIGKMKQVTYSYLSLYVEINFLLLTNCIKFSHLLIKYWLSHVNIFSSLNIMIITKQSVSNLFYLEDKLDMKI